MDDLMARTMVENLSKGINPFTGEDLPEADLCANKDIQRALQFVLYYCSIESYEDMLKREYRGEKNRPEKRAPWEIEKKKSHRPRSVSSKKRKPWTEEEDKKLYVLYYQEFRTVKQISEELNRTRSEIKERINKLFAWMY